jgi:hypothetical protein
MTPLSYPPPSHDPLLLPKPIPHHAPPNQATPALTLSDSSSTPSHLSHVAIDYAPSSSFDAPTSSLPPITRPILSPPSMNIQPYLYCLYALFCPL